MRKLMPPPKRGQDGRPPLPDDESPEGGRPQIKMPIWYFLIPLLLLVLIAMAAERPQRISYGEFRRDLEQDRIVELDVRTSEVRGLRKVDGEKEPQKFVATRLPGEDEALTNIATEKVGTKFDYEGGWLDNPLVYMGLMLVLLVVVWRFMMSRMNPAGGAVEFGHSRARMVAQRDVGITFDDVAGIPECKQELEEIVEFLRTPDKFTRLGGRIPKGVLLVGPPGTGKTLLAKAVAGEAGVTFFSLSGSDFVEMFVGVGAARVRDLFDQAQKNAPCIIFIDELDALGKARGSGYMGGHDEREQTLNALLVQMDGFTTQKGIIILAATNRPEMLDPALLRPGRFDRQVVVPPPDLKDREQILAVHTRGVSLGPNVDLRKVAGMTPGFVGADLANLVNEATLLAARRGKDQVEMVDFEQSLERVVAGLEKRNRLMNDEEKKIVAHHEAGHALVASLLPGTDPVHKVSMIPRGMAALGYTLQRPTEDRYLLRRDELMNRLAVMLGGRTAEEVCFDDISTGAQNDLQRATELAREMVVEFGMSDEVGPLSYGNEGSQRQEVFLGRPYSERTARRIDVAIRSTVDAAHRNALDLLTDHRDALLALAARLLDKEVLEQEELREVLGEHGIALPPQTPPPAEEVATPEPDQPEETTEEQAVEEERAAED